MAVIGFNFMTRDMRYAVLDGTRDAPNLVTKERIVYPIWGSVPESMGWFETQIGLILDNHGAQQVAYRFSLAIATVVQVQTGYYAQSILNLICHKKGIETIHYTNQGLNGTKIGLHRNADLLTHTDSVFGTHPPYWDKGTKEAILVAWFLL